MLVGAIGVIDLRILGHLREISLRRLSSGLLPLAFAGFAVMAVSGALLFAADVRALAGSSVFLVKLSLIGLAGLNALAFRLSWRLDEAPPLRVRAMAAGSLILWLTVVILGRLIAYF